MKGNPIKFFRESKMKRLKQAQMGVENMQRMERAAGTDRFIDRYIDNEDQRMSKEQARKGREMLVGYKTMK